MTDHRLKRPHLDRDHPIRTWGTLFQTAANGRHPAPGHANGAENTAEAPPVEGSSAGVSTAAPLADVVERGYRVINEYLRQGQTVAAGFNPVATNGAERPGASPDVQQLAQRVMQYGWDFAGLWFEMWTRMASSSGIAPPPPPTNGGQYPNRPDAPPAGRSQPESAARSLRVAVSVVCRRSTTTCVDLRPGPASPLAIHALRAEGTEAPPIRDVVIESSGADDAVTVKVVVGADQPPAVYNGLIVDASSNLPRGTLSLTIHPDQ